MDDGLAHRCQFHTLFSIWMCSTTSVAEYVFLDYIHCVCFLLSEVGCVASGRLFFSLSVGYLYISCLIFHVHIFVNVLSCVHVCIDCKNTLLCGGKIISIYLL